MLQPSEPVAGRERAESPAGVRMRAAQFWIQALVALSRHVPWLMRGLKPVGLWFTWRSSASLRDATLANAARLRPGASAEEVDGLAKGIVGAFYDFLMDMGRHRGKSAQELREEISRVDGFENFKEARRHAKGAILVTAHIGSFEVGAAAVREYEDAVHVVFQRDPMKVFEQLRTEQHRRLGLKEAAVDPLKGDDAWNVWLKLRDALREDEVVLMQGDRVMPGQRGRKVPFLGGHVMLPPGPVKLALATGSPIVPVCAPKGPDGRIRIVMEEPIWVEESESRGPNPAEGKLARVLEGWVKRYPDQWLMIQRVWCEDLPDGNEAR
jgi:KDO2-lipid IV(A) lauroyltransferase